MIISLRSLSVELLIVALPLSACGGGDSVIAPDGGTTTGKPAQLPDFAAIELYQTDAPVNQLLPVSPTIDLLSSAYVAKLASIAGSSESPPVLTFGQYSASVQIANATTPSFDVALPCGAAPSIGASLLRGVPIPDYAEPSNDTDGADNPIIPGECSSGSDQDNRMVILDLDSRCLYELWQARKEGDQWVASWGNSISMDSRGIYDKGLSTRGSGFSFLGGVIWPDELASGHIGHALVMSYPLTRAGGPVLPATQSDGWSSDPDALPEGSLLRLDPTVDIDALSLTPIEHTMAQAMQEYGVYLVDDGSRIRFYAIDPRSVSGDPYAGIFDAGTDNQSVAGIPWDMLQVLELPAQDADFLLNVGLVDSGCGTFE